MMLWRRSFLRSSLAALLLVPVVVLGAPAAAVSAATCSATTFNEFTAADDARLQRNGAAAYTVGNRLRVTTSSIGASGSTFTKSPISLTADASFSTSFSFEFTNPVGGGADGLAFVVQTVSNNVGTGGGGIGYQGIPKSVAVEFDNWDNTGDGINDGNSASHVGIDVNGDINSVVLTPVTPDLDAGGVRFAWVDYDGTTDTFEVRYATTNDRPAVPTLTRTLDLPTILESPDAFLGFTSANGSARAEHDVVTWQFTTCFAPLGQSTPPTVSAGPDVSGVEDTALALDGTVTDADPEETVTTAWSAVAGATCTFANAASVDTTVTCTEPGTYTFTLTANDGVNAAVSDSVVVTVTATPVVPKFQPIGYRMVGFDGGVFTFGERTFHGSLGDRVLNRPIVGGADDPATFEGYWLVASDGGVFAFGSAGFFGSLGSDAVTSPIVEMEPTPSGKGYWLVSAAGKVHAFGDAKHFGDMVTQALNKPVIGMAATSTGLGYWLVAEDGGIFAFGDAKFLGSMGSAALNAPIDDIAPLGNDAGYYLVARDGGVFSFGAAVFHGSTGSMTLNQPVIAMLVHPDGSGYWLAARDGGIFTFGSLPFFGSMGSVPLTMPINDLIH